MAEHEHKTYADVNPKPYVRHKETGELFGFSTHRANSPDYDIVPYEEACAELMGTKPKAKAKAEPVAEAPAKPKPYKPVPLKGVTKEVEIPSADIEVEGLEF